MSELSFEQMLEDSVKTIRNGEIVQGTVIDVKEDEIILNIGYKADGIITKNEYSNDASLVLTDAVHVGDTMEAKVLKVNDGEGQVLLTYKRLAADRGNKRIEEAYNNHEVLKATVSQVLDGGLSVIVDEVRIFIPASLVSDTYEKDLTKYAGQEIEFVISEYNPKRRRYIGDRKQLIVAKKAELQKELFEKIKEGDIIALENGRLTITEKSTVKALVKLAKDMVNRDTSFITLIYGEDVSEEEAEKAYGELREKFGSRTDITLVKGDQPVYYFILSVE